MHTMGSAELRRVSHCRWERSQQVESRGMRVCFQNSFGHWDDLQSSLKSRIGGGGGVQWCLSC